LFCLHKWVCQIKYAIIVNNFLQFSLILSYSFILLTALSNINVELEICSLTSEIEVRGQIHSQAALRSGKNWRLGEPQRHSGRFGAWKNTLPLP
jgi:hypothetical protein